VALSRIDWLVFPLRYNYTFGPGLDVTRLRKSYGEATRKFYVLRGRLCADMTVRVGRGDEASWSEGRAPYCVADVHSRHYADTMPSGVSLGDIVCAARLTALRDGYLLSLAVSHAVADHESFIFFWRAWAALYSGEVTAVLPPRFDRHAWWGDRERTSSELPPARPEWAVIPTAVVLHPPPPPEAAAEFVTACVEFSPATLRRIQASTGERTATRGLYAALYQALPCERMAFVMNLRNRPDRWSPPIPREFFGNAVTYGFLTPDAPGVTAAIRRCDSRYNHSTYRFLEDLVPPDGSAIPIACTDAVLVSSWNDLCAVRFGSLLPRFVFGAPIWHPSVVVITDTPHGDGSLTVLCTEQWGSIVRAVRDADHSSDHPPSQPSTRTPCCP